MSNGPRTGHMLVGDWVVRPQLNAMVSATGESLPVKPKAMDVLVCLCTQAPRVVTKQTLAEQVWEGAPVSDDVIAQAICELRRCFGDDAKNPEYIQTVPKRGYRLIAPIRTESDKQAMGGERRPPNRFWKALALLAAWTAILLIVLVSGHQVGIRSGEVVLVSAKPEANQEYLRAKYLLSKKTKEGWQAAVKHFEEAIRLDPQFAGGYLGLAESYLEQSEGFDTIPASEGYPRAREAALKALDLQPDIAGAHAMLAVIESANLRFQNAGREYEKALALNPGCADLHAEYGLFLSALGEHRKAIEHTLTALRITPFAIDINVFHGRALLYAGYTGRAIEQLLKAIELEPKAAMAYYFLFWGYLKDGHPDKAIGAYFKLLELQGVTEIPQARDAFVRAGVPGVAQWELRRVEQGVHPQSQSPVLRARLCALVGDNAEALDWLEKAYSEDYYFGLIWLKVDPAFDDLRSSDRFRRLVERIGFPPI